MKFAGLCLSLVAAAQAFAPVQDASRSSALRMSDSSRDLFEPQEKVPCFGAAPLLGGEVFVGENYWNKLTSEYGSAETGTFLRAA